MKTTIHDVTIVAREVEIPAVCPKCATPFASIGEDRPANLTQFSLLDAEAFYGRLDEHGDFERDDADDGYLDNTMSYATGYACRECGTMLVNSEPTVS